MYHYVQCAKRVILVSDSSSIFADAILDMLSMWKEPWVSIISVKSNGLWREMPAVEEVGAIRKRILGKMDGG